MPSRIVRPETTKLEISGGDWLLVKKRLNHGELSDALARKYVANEFGGHRLNLRVVNMEKVTAYLLDWSLVDLQEHVIEIRGKAIHEVESALNAIDPESFAEIFNAIEAHEQAMALARSEEKKRLAGETGASATSPSPAPVTGPLATSAT